VLWFGCDDLSHLGSRLHHRVHDDSGDNGEHVARGRLW
jgi:hypothetical protein